MELANAIQYSLDAATWVTWLAIGLLMFKSVHSYKVAYEDNETYEDMKNNKDKKGIANFYTAIVTSTLCVVVFFLPYIMYYEG
jgi:hypothetical protein